MAPALATVLNIGGLVINSVVSLIKDKKKGPRNDDEAHNDLLIPPAGSPVNMIATGMSISSKRLVNLSGTGLIFMMAAKAYRADGLSLELVLLLAVACAFSLAMAWITKKSEE